jgi:hypothetical protein
MGGNNGVPAFFVLFAPPRVLLAFSRMKLQHKSNNGATLQSILVYAFRALVTSGARIDDDCPW